MYKKVNALLYSVFFSNCFQFHSCQTLRKFASFASRFQETTWKIKFSICVTLRCQLKTLDFFSKRQQSSKKLILLKDLRKSTQIFSSNSFYSFEFVFCLRSTIIKLIIRSALYYDKTFAVKVLYSVYNKRFPMRYKKYIRNQPIKDFNKFFHQFVKERLFCTAN